MGERVCCSAVLPPALGGLWGVAGIVPHSFFLTGWFCSGTRPACMAYPPCVCSAPTQSQHDRDHFSACSLSEAEARWSPAKGLGATALCRRTSHESTASLLFRYFQFSFCLLLAECILFKILFLFPRLILTLRSGIQGELAGHSGLIFRCDQVPPTCTCLQ